MAEILDTLRALAAAEARNAPRRDRLPRVIMFQCPRCGVAKLPKHFAENSHVCVKCASEIEEHGDAFLWRPEAAR